jgi:molybdopterin converting factor small subunit
MQVTISYTGMLRREAGLAQETLELSDGATVAQALDAAAGRGGRFAELLRTLANVPFVDGTQAPRDQVLRPGATLTILSPISGG